MSQCSCENPTEFRITGEINELEAGEPEVGTGPKEARVRCVECGGKVTYIGSDFLEAFGIPPERLRPGDFFKEDEQIEITIDLI